MGIDAIVALVSLFGPKLIDLVKGWFGSKNSPEQTLASLAQTNPEALASYVNAQASLMTAQNQSVNADISGTPSEWVVNLRAVIRPAITITAIAHIVASHWAVAPIDASTMYVYEAAICSWFGTRMPK